VWWCTPAIPALRRLRKEEGKFEDSQAYVTRPCQKRKKERKKGE
jgi:hypothetical protein